MFQLQTRPPTPPQCWEPSPEEEEEEVWEGATKPRGPQDLDEGGSPSGRKSLSKHFLSWFLSVPGISADTLYAFLKKNSLLCKKH